MQWYIPVHVLLNCGISNYGNMDFYSILKFLQLKGLCTIIDDKYVYIVHDKSMKLSSFLMYIV